MERYAEIVAALKVRTTNRKGRHLSTQRAIDLLEATGVSIPPAPVSLSVSGNPLRWRARLPISASRYN